MFLRERASDVAQRAEALGCKRPVPGVGLCVDCPLAKTCPVKRVPLVLWTARVTQDRGEAEAIFYLNELTVDRFGKDDKTLPGTGLPTAREHAIELRCGDILTDKEWRGKVPAPTMNLPGYLRRRLGYPPQPPCRAPIIMDSRQARYLQISNHGRKAVLAVQCCSKEHAEQTAALALEGWNSLVDLLKVIRPRRAQVQDPSPA